MKRMKIKRPADGQPMPKGKVIGQNVTNPTMQTQHYARGTNLPLPGAADVRAAKEGADEHHMN